MIEIIKENKNMLFDENYFYCFISKGDEEVIGYTNKVGDFRRERICTLSGILLDDLKEALDERNFIIENGFILNRNLINSAIITPACLERNLVNLDTKKIIHTFKCIRSLKGTVKDIEFVYENIKENYRVEIDRQFSNLFHRNSDARMLEAQLKALGFLKIELTGGRYVYNLIEKNNQEQRNNLTFYTKKENISCFSSKKNDDGTYKIYIDFFDKTSPVRYILNDELQVQVVYNELREKILGGTNY